MRDFRDTKAMAHTLHAALVTSRICFTITARLPVSAALVTSHREGDNILDSGKRRGFNLISIPELDTTRVLSHRSDDGNGPSLAPRSAPERHNNPIEKQSECFPEQSFSLDHPDGIRLKKGLANSHFTPVFRGGKGQITLGTKKHTNSYSRRIRRGAFSNGGRVMSIKTTSVFGCVLGAATVAWAMLAQMATAKEPGPPGLSPYFYSRSVNHVFAPRSVFPGAKQADVITLAHTAKMRPSKHSQR
jgi:hypothetical protein